MAATGCYLYAIIDDGAEQNFGPIGLEGSDVYTIGTANVAAVVSAVPNRKQRPERRKLAAHFDVLKLLGTKHTVLPMAFGVIADDADDVQAILHEHHESFATQLQQLKGQVEMGLKLVWSVANIFDFFVAHNPELRALRDRVFASGSPSQDERMEVGRAFDEARTERRQTLFDALHTALAPVSTALKDNKPRKDTDAVHLACLLPSAERAAFEQAVEAFANTLGDDYQLELTGPFPPHNFVEVHLSPSED
jgi:hypothetical protein